MRPVGSRFRWLVLGAAVAVSPLALPQGTPDLKFFSWYDGWGTHEVWGVGKISSSYADAAVRCGRLMVNVVPIYDTHTALQPPRKDQSADYAKVHNIKVVAHLQSKGLQCDFGKKAGAT